MVGLRLTEAVAGMVEALEGVTAIPLDRVASHPGGRRFFTFAAVSARVFTISISVVQRQAPKGSSTSPLRNAA